MTAAVAPACSVIASPVAHADPVATTATVLKVVDGDTVNIVEDVRGRLRIRLLGPPRPDPSAAGQEAASCSIEGPASGDGPTLPATGRGDGWDTGSEGPGRGLGGRHASAKRPQYQSDSSRCASAKRSRCARARRSVGPQTFRDEDVVALEFTGVAGGGAVYGWWLIRVGRRLRPRKRLRGSRIQRTPRAAPDAWPSRPAIGRESTADRCRRAVSPAEAQGSWPSRDESRYQYVGNILVDLPQFFAWRHPHIGIRALHEHRGLEIDGLRPGVDAFSEQRTGFQRSPAHALFHALCGAGLPVCVRARLGQRGACRCLL